MRVEANTSDCLAGVGSGQHTFVATLRLALQKAGEGWLRLPFKPLHRLSADQASLRSRARGLWTASLLGSSYPIGRVAPCG